MLILEDLILATPRVPGPGQSWSAQIDTVSDAAIAVRGDQILWAGPRSELQRALAQIISSSPVDMSVACTRLSLGGSLVTPALVDCHTHMVFGGDRADEWRLRQNGVTYEEIAQRGGGIASTVKASRDLTVDDLVSIVLARARSWLRSGCGLIEIKSGYGLSAAAEENLLRAVQVASGLFPGVLRSTFLGAHMVPAEHSASRQGYLSLVCNEMMPAFARAGLCQSVDVFCESIAFTPSEAEEVCRAAKILGLGIHIHAEQLSWQGGASLAARYRALSADHLEYATEADVRAMAASGVTAVLLPGSFLYLREEQLPPVSLFRKFNVPIAVATDYNPGTSPLRSLPLAGSLATLSFGLTPEESFAGVTLAAARALGLGDAFGAVGSGFRAHLAVWSVPRWESLFYETGENFCTGVLLSECESRRLGPAFGQSW
jgi:imidazolonepropionase